MKINKIVLYNFNSYEGLNEFDFTSENSSKNIILIGGKNGAGKTSLFMAIKLAYKRGSESEPFAKAANISGYPAFRVSCRYIL